MELDKKHIDQIGVQDVSEVPDRIGWNSISSHVLSVMNIERGVFYTLVELLFRPGKAVRLHLFKSRKKLLNPVRFLVLSSTLATFITLYYVDLSGFTDGFEESFKIGLNDGSENQIERNEMQVVFTRFGDIFHQFLNVGYFVLVPIGAFVTWLFCRKKYNVPELAVVHCYLWSMVNCFTIVLTPLILFNESVYLVLSTLGFVYPLYFYTKFFRQGGKGFLKGGIILAISMFFLVIFFGILTVYSFYDIETVINPNSSKF